MTGAHEYAAALFSLTEEDGTTDAVLADLMVAEEALAENPDYPKLADTPALPRGEKIALVRAAFASLALPVRNLLSLLSEHHAVYLFPEIVKSYRALCDEARGIERVRVITAVPLSEKQSAALTEKLSAMTGKTIIIENTVDPTILGGVKLRYAGTQLDGSLRTRLDAIEKNLKSAIL